MAKPVILAVDDDTEVLRAVERDLRRKYGRDYRVLSADRGEAALETVRQLRLRGDPVALFLVDQRMPGMSGVEFLEKARDLYDEARRVLLTAYADTQAAIHAINEVRLDHYLLKPWEPPEERLYPVLSDLLDEWWAHHPPSFEGIRVLGNRWSPRSHSLRDFLGSNQVPYQWLDVEGSDEGQLLLTQAGGAAVAKLPLVLFPDGTRLMAPDNVDVAERIGLKVRATKPFYDLVIIGGGPAGLAAAVYGASEGLSTVMVERSAPGGQAGTSSRIENYLGFPAGLSGADLARRAVAQAARFGVEILTPQEVSAVRVADPYRIVKLGDGTELSCHALLVATGVQWRRLPTPGMEALSGAGVYYGAARTEAVSCKNEEVFIIGGANSAGQAALYFAQFAKRVTLVVRGDSLERGMSHYLVEQVHSTPNVTVLLHTEVMRAEGAGHLERVTLRTQGEAERTLPASALFIMIGAVPRTEWLDGVVARDDRGYVLTGPDLTSGGQRPRGWKPDREPFLLETNVPGIFAAGDVRHASIKRVASGVGEGSIAISFIHQYLSEV
ncbi:FAD-dependent oxidoreductase [Myxococcus sp. K15C18031901]|uniref:FAD-dependent oxidoreductase n=1 Tax=Myxococcus dinghuensis TaxID=2906761 RepID=UPI0020A77352|nr:FAD-dependent oxidoreductase [Myxococcus dinghuensis]MCP3100688.1 FAD-dependent oxidoreductase [Myxococcus dinghuensis]